jgi:nicotinate phosphoribosyltransferase
VGQWLRARGHEMIGIRLDSGNLAQLSIAARDILDAAGFPNARIVGSSDLDEHLITQLKEQGSTIDVWGVGTKLVTAYDQPALGGVYKLTAVRAPDGSWQDRIKLSEETVKVTNPDIPQVRRYHTHKEFLCDVMYGKEADLADGCTMVDVSDPATRRRISGDTAFSDLLAPVFRQGRSVYESPPLTHIRQRTREQLAKLPGDITRLNQPGQYPVGLEESLYERKTQLIRLAEWTST